jgi:hypothetical protein
MVCLFACCLAGLAAAELTGAAAQLAAAAQGTKDG